MTDVDALPDGTRPDASAAAQAAILQVLDATPPGQLPTGYQPTGQVLEGESSWYGPGFVGSPTSSGVPYDPEKLTCAMLRVPLGTVVRVTTATGATVVAGAAAVEPISSRFLRLTDNSSTAVSRIAWNHGSSSNATPANSQPTRPGQWCLGHRRHTNG